jgi:hypothetical protein
VGAAVKKPVNAKLFTLSNVLIWGGLDLVVTALGVGASLTEQDPPVPLVGWIILWATIAGFWGITALYFRWRWVHIKNLRFVLDPPGSVVGWADDQYCVFAEQVQAECDDLITKMSGAYPKAADALRGCVVWFREPTFIQAVPGFAVRKVAGVQDGMFILVGWREDLKTSALKHELAHRVLQVYAGDPVESTAHEMLAKLGL